MAKTEDMDFVQIRIRAHKKLHKQLDIAATERGASMNAEIVDRLERSFQIDRIIGGPIVEDRPLLAIAKLIAASMHDAGRHAAFTATRSVEVTANWTENAYAYDQAIMAATTILEAFRPRGPVVAPKLFDQNDDDLTDVCATLGKAFANGLLLDVTNEKSSTSNSIEKIALIREELGALRERIPSSVKHGMVMHVGVPPSTIGGPKPSMKGARKK
jgi:hypothetical protein